MFQVGDLHEALVEVVKLQDTGQQEETGDQDAAEELRQFKRLQPDVGQSAQRTHRPDDALSTIAGQR